MATTIQDRMIQAFDTNMEAGQDAARAALACTDRPLVARMAAQPETLWRFATCVARPGAGAVGHMAVRGWVAGFMAAALEAAGTYPIGKMIVSAQTRAADKRRGVDSYGFVPRGHWMVCSACGDLGRMVTPDGPVACGYCCEGIPVNNGEESNLRIFMGELIAQEMGRRHPVMINLLGICTGCKQEIHGEMCPRCDAHCAKCGSIYRPADQMAACPHNFHPASEAAK